MEMKNYTYRFRLLSLEKPKLRAAFIMILKARRLIPEDSD